MLAATGVFSIVSCGLDLLPVDMDEIEAIRRVVAEGIPARSVPFMAVGARARVIRGVLAGVEGIVIQDRESYSLVSQVTLLHMSIRVQINRDCVKPTSTLVPHGTVRLIVATQPTPG